MKWKHRVLALVGSILTIGLLSFSCGSSHESMGVTSSQPSSGGKCLDRGATCILSADCCSGWCANAVCAIRSP
jgi:hypothetical protein